VNVAVSVTGAPANEGFEDEAMLITEGACVTLCAKVFVSGANPAPMYCAEIVCMPAASPT
jgi:hypothetical protein